jgi:VanZ family protein
MVFGNSVTAKQSWVGQLYGLALYDKVFSPNDVRLHFARWQREKRFPHEGGPHLLALYTFEQKPDPGIVDQTGLNQPLRLPGKPIVLRPTILSPPWKDFRPDRSLFVDAFKNFIGFIPLGVVLSGYLTYIPFLQAKFRFTLILLLCFLISLMMEILQAWMPARSSSLLDLILNTVGSCLGIWLFEKSRQLKFR